VYSATVKVKQCVTKKGDDNETKQNAMDSQSGEMDMRLPITDLGKEEML